MKHTIEIEGLPEGWEAVAYRIPRATDKYWNGKEIHYGEYNDDCYAKLIVQKTKPREITIVETEYDNFKNESNNNYLRQHLAHGVTISGKSKIWRIKEE